MKIRQIISHLFTLFVAIILVCCKKKTDIKITVFNPYIQKCVQDAKVSITEAHHSNFLTSGWGKQYDKTKTIASSTTDIDGVVFFDKEKLRLNNNYEYWFILEESWGVINKNFDRSKYQSLNKGKTNDIIVCDYTKGTAKVQFNNLFVSAQSGDSISIYPHWFDLYDPLANSYIEGEGIFETHIAYDAFSTLPSNYSFSSYPDQAYGKALLTIRKRKLGILTIDTMIVQFLPKQTVIVNINW